MYIVFIYFEKQRARKTQGRAREQEEQMSSSPVHFSKRPAKAGAQLGLQSWSPTRASGTQTSGCAFAASAFVGSQGSGWPWSQV